MTNKFTLALLTFFTRQFCRLCTANPNAAGSPSAKTIQKVGLTDVTVDYSRPSTKGRKIFGELVPFGEVWRTGANGATVLTFSTDVTVGGQHVPAGSYALYTIPGKNDWTIILSKNTKLWGSIGYQQSDDQVRFEVPASKTSKKYETFDIAFNNFTDNSAVVSMKWETTRVDFKIETEVDPIVMAEIQKLVIDTKSTDPALLFQAASYYFTNSKDLNQAYAWVKTSTDSDPKYWTVHLRAKIEVALGMKTEALESATQSKAMAQEAKNPDYIALNERLIKSIR
ncbi:DUF2911 domain-containing protein [Algoriphagus boritolerans]|uniref:DUF2911 domain-containing protein n=1 Tax=Algoriphagus boritolerans TaxID=308111 RepID=UPI000AEF0944